MMCRWNLSLICALKIWTLVSAELRLTEVLLRMRSEIMTFPSDNLTLTSPTTMTAVKSLVVLMVKKSLEWKWTMLLAPRVRFAGLRRVLPPRVRFAGSR